MKNKDTFFSVLVWSVIFCWWITLFFLNPWKSWSKISNSNIYVVHVLSFILLFCFGKKIIKSNQQDKSAILNIMLQRKNFVWLAMSLFISIVVLYFFAYPQLNYPMHTWGDEDFHFSITTSVKDYLNTYFSNNKGLSVVRYPGLLYFFYSFFINEFFGFSNLDFYQRFPLFIIYILTVIIFYFLSLDLIKKPFLAFLASLLMSTQATLLAYTVDKYLDIAHPIIMAAAFYFTFKAFNENKLKLYFSASLITSLIPFVRDNGLPSALIITGFIFFISFWRNKNLRNSLLFALIACGPFFLFLLFKTLGTSVDVNRLSLNNISQQNYYLFLKFLPFYISPFVVFAPMLIVLNWQKNKNIAVRMTLFLLFMAILGQLAIYSLFQPGWMPWSRNYLMFTGIFFIFGLLCVNYFLPIKWFFAFSIVSIIIQIYQCYAFLNTNTYFHEIEIVFDYPNLNNFISHNSKLENEKIYMNIPLSIPSAFDLAGLNRKQFVEVKSNSQPPNWQFLDFSSLINEAPPDAHYFLYHFHTHQHLVSIVKNFPSAHQVNLSQQKKFRLIQLFEDPRSQSKSGLALIERL